MLFIQVSSFQVVDQFLSFIVNEIFCRLQLLYQLFIFFPPFKGLEIHSGVVVSILKIIFFLDQPLTSYIAIFPASSDQDIVIVYFQLSVYQAQLLFIILQFVFQFVWVRVAKIQSDVECIYSKVSGDVSDSLGLTGSICQLQLTAQLEYLSIIGSHSIISLQLQFHFIFGGVLSIFKTYIQFGAFVLSVTLVEIQATSLTLTFRIFVHSAKG